MNTAYSTVTLLSIATVLITATATAVSAAALTNTHSKHAETQQTNSDNRNLLRNVLITDNIHTAKRLKRHIRVRAEIMVDVPENQRLINLYPGNSAMVKCRAKGGDQVEDQPYVSFFRKIGDHTEMPVSSGDPGVVVEPSVPSEEDFQNFFGYEDNPNEMRSVKVLTLSPDAYDTLEKDDNLFYCKVSTLSGETAKSYFVVKKHVPKPPKRRGNFRFGSIPNRG